MRNTWFSLKASATASSMARKLSQVAADRLFQNHLVVGLGQPSARIAVTIRA